MKNYFNKHLHTVSRSFITFIILLLVSYPVLNKPQLCAIENILITQHNKTCLINLPGHENQQIIIKIIKLFVNANSIIILLIIISHVLKFINKNEISIRKYNKYPRWSKSTFS